MEEKQAAYRRARRQLLCASSFCFLFMVLEALGGWYVSSLAIMSDAAHLLADCAGFAMSLVGLYVAQKPTTLKYTYGYQRAEIIGAIMSVLLLWLLTGIIIYNAVLRLLHPEEVHGREMFIIATCGLLVNVIMGMILAQSGHGHSHGGLPGDDSHSHSHAHSHAHAHAHGHTNSVNRTTYGTLVDAEEPSCESHQEEEQSMAVRSAFLHVLGDGIQSVGVMIAAALIWYNPAWKIADPICSFLFALIVLATTPKILKQGFSILLNAAPTNMSKNIYEDLYRVKCIQNVHDLHLWPLSASGKLALTVHIVATDKVVALKSAQDIAIKYGVRHTTIQVECAGCDQTDCDEVSNCTIVNTHQCIVEDAESLQTALSVLEADDNDDLNTRLL